MGTDSRKQKRQSSQWKHPDSPKPKKARQNQGGRVTVSFDVSFELCITNTPKRQTVTKEYYQDVLRRTPAIRRKKSSRHVDGEQLALVS
ncbi:hypothetical protein NPIL_318921 [Nephila pilipes]|uniref:Uncharacterized protein n=1 Tax=Nephila pilipes TaxID=299642 RepID=A0A8X6UEU0_NEPPI|nr:hypothetical protein NPIL_318921 [Nephila pilipes]